MQCLGHWFGEVQDRLEAERVLVPIVPLQRKEPGPKEKLMSEIEWCTLDAG